MNESIKYFFTLWRNNVTIIQYNKWCQLKEEEWADLEVSDENN